MLVEPPYRQQEQGKRATVKAGVRGQGSGIRPLPLRAGWHSGAIRCSGRGFRRATFGFGAQENRDGMADRTGAQADPHGTGKAPWESMVGMASKREPPSPNAGGGCDRATWSGEGETEPRAPGGLGDTGCTSTGRPHPSPYGHPKHDILFANLTVLELEFRPLQNFFSGNPVETAKEGNRESTERTKEPPCSSTRSLPDASPAGMR